MIAALRKQVALLRTVMLTVLLPIVVVYLILAVQPFVPVGMLLRDANAEAYDSQGVIFYRGALSNIGILLWWTSASMCAFAAFLLRTTVTLPGKRTNRVFLIYMAVFTGLLALDDLFMFHEEVLPVRLGVPELVLYAVYGVLAAGLIGFVQLLLETDFLLLGLAFSFFAFSVLTDQGMLRFLFDIRGSAGLLIEDLAKMLGIVCWLVFSLRTAVQLLGTRAEVRTQLRNSRANETVIVVGKSEQPEL